MQFLIFIMKHIWKYLKRSRGYLVIMFIVEKKRTFLTFLLFNPSGYKGPNDRSTFIFISSAGPFSPLSSLDTLLKAKWIIFLFFKTYSFWENAFLDVDVFREENVSILVLIFPLGIIFNVFFSNFIEIFGNVYFLLLHYSYLLDDRDYPTVWENLSNWMLEFANRLWFQSLGLIRSSALYYMVKSKEKNIICDLNNWNERFNIKVTIFSEMENGLKESWNNLSSKEFFQFNNDEWTVNQKKPFKSSPENFSWFLYSIYSFEFVLNGLFWKQF